MNTTDKHALTKTQALELAQARYLNRVSPGYRQRWISWSGGKVQVLEMGEGEPLLFIHGGLGDAFQYGSLFSPLAKNFRVLALDRPGHGLSDPFDYDGVNLLTHSEDFIQQVLSHEKLNKVTMLASSMGGLWALNFALNYPNRLQQIILLGSPAGVTRNLPAQLRFGTLPLLRNLIHKLMQKPTPDSVKGFWKQMLVARPQKLAADFIEASTASQARNAPNWFTLIDAAMNVRGLRKHLLIGDRWKSLKVPVTCLWGDKDVWARPNLAEEIKSMTPLFKTVVIAEAGHAPWFDDRETILEEIYKLLAQYLNPQASATSISVNQILHRNMSE